MFDERPDTGTRIAGRGPAVSLVFLVEVLGSLCRALVPAFEFSERRRRQILVAVRQSPCATLDRMSINVRRLILEVQNQPELDAWIGECEMDPVAPRKGTSFVKVRMVVAVEDTPGLIVGAPLAALRGRRLFR